MTRVKRGVMVHKRHKKVLKAVKGFRGRTRTNFKLAKAADRKAKMHAYRDRKLKKRDFRSLWISRLTAALKLHGLNYSRFVKMMKEKKVEIDRKALSNIAAQYPEVFEQIVKLVK